VSDNAESESPQATVIIPTRNRIEILLQAIRSVLQQTIPVELFVMDDGSTDGTAERVAREFPTAKVYREENSRGPAWQRNRGADLASTPVLVTLDDDCVFASPRTLSQVLVELEPLRVGAVTIPFINVMQDNIVHTAAPAADRICCTAVYFGGMVAFKRTAYRAVGGYRSWYFMHVEEPDLAIRLLNAGYVVRLGSADPIHHYASPTRNSLRLHELGPRNHVIFAWQNVPMPHLLAHLPATIAGTVWYATKIGHPLRGLRGALLGIGASLGHPRWRSPVSPAVYRLHRELRRRGAIPLAELELRLPPLEHADSLSLTAAPIQTTG
jgi:glycosyltransferase involved in cell wall biosynthesis